MRELCARQSLVTCSRTRDAPAHPGGGSSGRHAPRERRNAKRCPEHGQWGCEPGLVHTPAETCGPGLRLRALRGGCRRQAKRGTPGSHACFKEVTSTSVSANTVVLSWTRFCLPGVIWPPLKTFLAVTTGGKGVTVAPSGWRPRMRLNVSKPHNTGPTAKIYQLQMSVTPTFGNPAFS